MSSKVLSKDGDDTRPPPAGGEFQARADAASVRLRELCRQYGEALESAVAAAATTVATPTPNKPVSITTASSTATSGISTVISSSDTDAVAATIIPAEVQGLMRAATGQAQLLLTKRLPQFSGLCAHNVTPVSDEPPTTNDDLAGFWDLVLLAIDDVYDKFKALDAIRDNGWVLPPPPSPSSSKISSHKQGRRTRSCDLSASRKSNSSSSSSSSGTSGVDGSGIGSGGSGGGGDGNGKRGRRARNAMGKSNSASNVLRSHMREQRRQMRAAAAAAQGSDATGISAAAQDYNITIVVAGKRPASAPSGAHSPLSN